MMEKVPKPQGFGTFLVYGNHLYYLIVSKMLMKFEKCEIFVLQIDEIII